MKTRKYILILLLSIVGVCMIMVLVLCNFNYKLDIEKEILEANRLLPYDQLIENGYLERFNEKNEDIRLFKDIKDGNIRARISIYFEENNREYIKVDFSKELINDKTVFYEDIYIYKSTNTVHVSISNLNSKTSDLPKFIEDEIKCLFVE